MVMFRLMLHLMIAINHKLKNEKDAQIKPPQEAYGNQIQILMCTPLVNYRLLMRLKVSIFCFFFCFLFFPFATHCFHPRLPSIFMVFYFGNINRYACRWPTKCYRKRYASARSTVAINSVSVTSCKADEAEFTKGLSLLTSLKHENLARLRGFCCSKGRGECFLVYDFASKGNLSEYLDLEDGRERRVLDWPKRVSIINAITNGKSCFKLLFCFHIII